MYSREELKQLKINFWTEFAQHCHKKQVFKHRLNKFILHDTKMKGVQLKFKLTRSNTSVILEFTGTQQLINRRYQEFFHHKDLFIETFQPDIVTFLPHYQRSSGQVVARIYVEQTGYDFHCPQDWAAIFHFMSANMQKLELIFVQLKKQIELA